MTEFGLALKLAVQKHGAMVGGATIMPLLIRVVDQLKQYQPIWAKTLSPIHLNPVLARAQQLAFREKRLDPQLEDFRRSFKGHGERLLATLVISLPDARRKIPTRTAANTLAIGELEAALKTTALEVGAASEFGGQMLEEIARVEAMFKPTAPSGGGGAGKPSGARPGQPGKPAPRPNAKPPAGKPRPPSAAELRPHCHLLPDSGGLGLFGPMRLPLTVVQSHHPSLTIHVTIESVSREGPGIPWYYRVAVPPRGSAPIGCQIPGPTNQRFEYRMVNWEL